MLIPLSCQFFWLRSSLLALLAKFRYALGLQRTPYAKCFTPCFTLKTK